MIWLVSIFFFLFSFLKQPLRAQFSITDHQHELKMCIIVVVLESCWLGYLARSSSLKISRLAPR